MRIKLLKTFTPYRFSGAFDNVNSNEEMRTLYGKIIDSRLENAPLVHLESSTTET